MVGLTGSTTGAPVFNSMLSQLESAELPADAVEIGRIAEAWGIKGWFKVLPYSADPEALFFLQTLVYPAD